MDTKADIMQKLSKMGTKDLMRKKAELKQQQRALRDATPKTKQQPACLIATKGGYKDISFSIPAKATEINKYVGAKFSSIDFVHGDDTYRFYYSNSAQVKNKLAKKLCGRWFQGNVVILGVNKDTVMGWGKIDFENTLGEVQSNSILENGEPLSSSSSVTIEDCADGMCSISSIEEYIRASSSSSSDPHVETCATQEEWDRSTSSSSFSGTGASQEEWDRSTSDYEGPREAAGDRGS